MKIRLIAIIGILFIVFTGLTSFDKQLSRAIVNHRDAGNFVNTNDLNQGEITMLHWFADNVEVYSEEKSDLSFVVFDPYKGLAVFKNKDLVIQNESPLYPAYQGTSYVTFSILESDYIENRVEIFSEVTLRDKNDKLYGNNYFVGPMNKIIELIIVKNIVNMFILMVFIFVMAIIVFAHKDEKKPFFLLASYFLMIFNFSAGFLTVITAIYFYSDRLFRQKNKQKLLVVFIIISGVLSFNSIYLKELVFMIKSLDFYFGSIKLISLYLLVLLVLNIVNSLKNKNTNAYMSLVATSSLFLMSMIDYEFSFFRIFYQEIIYFIIALSIFSLCIKKMMQKFSTSRTIRVDRLRGISHDLRVPLSIIKLNVDLLSKDDFTTEMNKDEIYHITRGAIDDLSNMTSSLTAYMSSDSYIRKNYSASIQDAIENTSNYYYNNEKNIEIIVDTCEEDIYLPIEETWLNRLLYNLIDNSYKYTAEYGEIIIRLNKSHKKIILSVEDNGIGMTEDEVAKILEPFYRIDKSRSIPGLGIGLSIVSTIVDNLGGRITITSIPEEGTVFTITI